jgi:hypothetical protein
MNDYPGVRTKIVTNSETIAVALKEPASSAPEEKVSRPLSLPAHKERWFARGRFTRC